MQLGSAKTLFFKVTGGNDVPSVVAAFLFLKQSIMEKEYRKIEFSPGESIEKAISYLSRFKESGELVFGEFNGHKLYSDIDDMDSAYLKIIGKTKAEFDEDRRKEHEEYKEKERKHKESIPQLTKEWIEKGNAVLDEEYHSEWARCVPIRLDDLYQGMELKACLDIIIELNSGCTLDKAKEIIESQGHSGMSFGLVCLMVKSFCKRGAEFVSFVR